MLFFSVEVFFMKQSLRFLGVFLMVTLSVFSQRSSIDSLEQVLENSRDDIDKPDDDAATGGTA